MNDENQSAKDLLGVEPQVYTNEFEGAPSGAINENLGGRSERTENSGVKVRDTRPKLAAVTDDTDREHGLTLVREHLRDATKRPHNENNPSDFDGYDGNSNGDYGYQSFLDRLNAKNPPSRAERTMKRLLKMPTTNEQQARSYANYEITIHGTNEEKLRLEAENHAKDAKEALRQYRGFGGRPEGIVASSDSYGAVATARARKDWELFKAMSHDGAIEIWNMMRNLATGKKYPQPTRMDELLQEDRDIKQKYIEAKQIADAAQKGEYSGIRNILNNELEALNESLAKTSDQEAMLSAEIKKKMGLNDTDDLPSIEERHSWYSSHKTEEDAHLLMKAHARIVPIEQRKKRQDYLRTILERSPSSKTDAAHNVQLPEAA